MINETKKIVIFQLYPTGVVFVISVDAGEVLDYHVLSKACQKRALKKVKGSSEEEFEKNVIT